MPRRKPLEGILKPRDLRNPYIAAGLAGRLATNVEIGSRTARVLDHVMERLALGPLATPNDGGYGVPTELWHGTGRYKYKEGEVVDVLEGIAATRTILPNQDNFDLLRPMTSISLARSRMYARAYADMFGNGQDERERYGSSLLWACSFLGSVAIEASKETKVWRPSGYYKMMGHLATANAIEWYKKITRVPNPSVVSVYRDGSDIHDNYPVLFGVRSVEPTVTSNAVALHEVRTEQPLNIDADITHVEVPRSHIEGTRRVLGGIATMAIEDGETISSQYTFTQHMHGIV